MKVVYLTTTTIQIKPYTIYSSQQLGLEVERYILLFRFYTIKRLF